MKSFPKLFCSTLLLVFPVLELWAQDTREREIEYGEAQHALAAGNYAEAEKQFQALAKAEPSLPEIHANLGLIYFEERKFEEAVPELHRALQLKPSLSNSQYILAMSYSELGRYADALPGLEKGFHSTNPEMKRMCGLQLERAYTGVKRDSDAVKVALEMEQLYPKDPEVQYHDGKIFGNFAFLSMQRLFEMAPNSVWTHQAAAEAYESSAAYDSAIAQYQQVLSIDPQRSGVHYRLGRTFLARSRATNSPQDLGRAVEEFEQELRLDPLNASAAYEIAEIHRRAGEFSEAQTYFELALKNYPDFEEAHLGLAAALTESGKPDSAAVHLKKAIALDSDNEVSWYRLARVERSLGNREDAERALARFHQLHDEKVSAQLQAEKTSLFSADEVTKQTIGTDEQK